MTNSRLFTFGCSFTRYHYPTWADIVGKNFSEFQNWGRAGAGNNFILNSLNECDLRNNIGTNDTVIIMWSGLSRIDYYQINNWTHMHQRYYDLKSTKYPYSCPQGYEMLSYAWMTSAVHVLNQIGCKWKMFQFIQPETESDAVALYTPMLSNIVYAPFAANSQPYALSPRSRIQVNDLFHRLKGKDWPGLESILDGSFESLTLDDFIKNECREFLTTVKKDRSISSNLFDKIDTHPSPNTHLQWVEKNLSEYLINETTKQWINHIDDCLRDKKSYVFDANNPIRF
jgi:hypothetical protein